MTTKENARRSAGAESVCNRSLARFRSLIKAAVVTAALWNFLPYRVAEWIIRRLRLRGA